MTWFSLECMFTFHCPLFFNLRDIIEFDIIVRINPYYLLSDITIGFCILEDHVADVARIDEQTHMRMKLQGIS